MKAANATIWSVPSSPRLSEIPKLVHGQADVFGNLPKQTGRNIPPFVHGNCGLKSADGIPVLAVRTTLANTNESKGFEYSAEFVRFQNVAHTSYIIQKLKNKNVPSHFQARAKLCVPTNSASRVGSPSSNNISITSRKLACNSSSVSPCECAPGKPGTYPTSKPVSASRSITAV